MTSTADVTKLSGITNLRAFLKYDIRDRRDYVHNVFQELKKKT